ncbi:MAG: alpha/beta hydrolase [Pseudomonadota bacterium]|nr:alpha/beta hydrolase [Pseudomonadota bacterium]
MTETLTAAGITTTLVQAGDRSATEAVVFLHGLPSSHRDWDLLLPQVGAFARAVAFDMPGLGASGPLPAGWDHRSASYGAFISAALRELGIARAHVVGHDFGVPWGLAWGASEPVKWGSMVLIDSGHLRGFQGHALAQRLRRPVIGELFPYLASPAKARASLARAPGARPLPDDFLDVLHGDWTRRNVRTMVSLYRANRPDDAALDQAQRTLAPLDVPALVIWGGRDPFLESRFAAEQRMAFPSADVQILPESGHWPHRDDPERANALVLSFLRKQVKLAAY